MNNITINKKTYKVICAWRNKKKHKIYDSDKNLFLYPKKSFEWSGQLSFLEQLKKIQKFINDTEHVIKLDFYDYNLNCLICKKSNIVSSGYRLKNFIWDDGLYHYIKFHNIKPDDEFIDMIWNINITEPNKIKLNARIKIKNNNKYLKLDKNQLMILDALMKHGGYNKKYYDSINNNLIRYSEHAGYIDIKGNNVNNVIVSGHTLRVDVDDKEIFLPLETKETLKYKYIFHTHPPTPKPGGRVVDDILYEFPSIGDILHFIDNHNGGNTIGSLVMTPEGLYNIKKNSMEKSKIKINEDNMYNEIRKTQGKIQFDAIEKYGKKFTSYEFYSKIAQDRTYINLFNNVLNKYELNIDFYPRTKDFKSSWIVDTIYLSVL
jgi:hypothetical protein